jgi:hypothetical protein
LPFSDWYLVRRLARERKTNPYITDFLEPRWATTVKAKDRDFIKFLGTAGVYLRINGKNNILDPGPGTLVRCAKSKPDEAILTYFGVFRVK